MLARGVPCSSRGWCGHPGKAERCTFSLNEPNRSIKHLAREVEVVAADACVHERVSCTATLSVFLSVFLSPFSLSRALSLSLSLPLPLPNIHTKPRPVKNPQMDCPRCTWTAAALSPPHRKRTPRRRPALLNSCVTDITGAPQPPRGQPAASTRPPAPSPRPYPTPRSTPQKHAYQPLGHTRCLLRLDKGYQGRQDSTPDPVRHAKTKERRVVTDAGNAPV